MTRRSFSLLHPIFDRRSSRPLVLPLIALALAGPALMKEPVERERVEQQEPRSVVGLRGDGAAYDCTTLRHRALLEFCVYWTREVR